MSALPVDELPEGHDTIRGGVFPVSATGLRLCHWCRASLEGRRPQTKYCGEACRVSYTRAGRARLSHLDRKTCAECVTFDRKCSKHSTIPARGRRDTTYPLPLFNPGRTTTAFGCGPNGKWRGEDSLQGDVKPDEATLAATGQFNFHRPRKLRGTPSPEASTNETPEESYIRQETEAAQDLTTT